MSPMGQKRTWTPGSPAMSALPTIADIRWMGCDVQSGDAKRVGHRVADVRYTPKSGHQSATMSAMCQSAAICRCSNQHRYSITSSAMASRPGGNHKAKRLGGLEIDHELKLGRLQHRQVRRLLAFENSTGIDADLAIGSNIGSIAHQAAGHGKLAKMVHRGHRMACRQATSLSRRVSKNGSATTDQRRDALLRNGLECGLDFAIGVRPQDMNLQADGARRLLRCLAAGSRMPESWDSQKSDCAASGTNSRSSPSRFASSVWSKC